MVSVSTRSEIDADEPLGGDGGFDLVFDFDGAVPDDLGGLIEVFDGF